MGVIREGTLSLCLIAYWLAPHFLRLQDKGARHGDLILYLIPAVLAEIVED